MITEKEFEYIINNDFEGATDLTFSDYARYIGISPQLLNYYIKNGQIKWHWCNCGRKVINIESNNRIGKRLSKKHK